MSFSLQLKSVVYLRKLGILSQTFCKMESTFSEKCSVNVPLLEIIGLYGGLISRLLASCVICAVSMMLCPNVNDYLIDIIIYIYNIYILYLHIKSVIKEWKLYINVNSAKHLFCKSPVCAFRQSPNLRRMLVNLTFPGFQHLSVTEYV